MSNNQTQEESQLAQLAGVATWAEVMIWFGGMGLEGIKAEADRCWPEDDNQEFANRIFAALPSQDAPTDEQIKQSAYDKVLNSEALAAYRFELIDYDWENEAEHYEWIATTDESELLSWAQIVRRDADDNEELDALIESLR